MCLAIPGKIVNIQGDTAIVDYGNEQREAKLINMDIKRGDFVVVQNKMILQKVPEKEALQAQKLWEQVLEDES